MKEINTSTSCVFTIVSKNYLPYARTLMASVKQHTPESDLVIVICDKTDPADQKNENFEILPIDQLNIQNFDEFVFQYTILELNTAVKPFAFDYFFTQRTYSKVIYFDPDILVYNSLQTLLDYLDDHQIVITPHLTGPLNDGLRPKETDILKAGTYNLGFIALSVGRDTRQLLSWWSDHLSKQCIVDVANGIFVDQKWIDLVPGMFENVKINRDPGWNVAYWNLLHRKVTKNESGYLVNGIPLTFFHFSGIKAKQKIFSIHQNRYQYDSLPSVVKELADDYLNELAQNDKDGISDSPYTYANFEDGTPIPDVMRYAYRRNIDSYSGKQQLSLQKLQPWLVEFLNEPADVGGLHFPYVTRLGYEIYSIRHDLKLAFPSLSSGDAMAYGGWYADSASREYGLPSVLVNGVMDAILHSHAGNSIDVQNKSIPVYNLGQRIFIKYKQYPHLYKLFSSFTSPEFRVRIRNRLLKQKKIDLTKSIQEKVEIKQSADSGTGINVIGYLQAESGTGEAVRSTLRAVKTTDVKVSAIDVRYSNISRMEEISPVQASQEQKYNVNLFHINADQAPVILNELGQRFYDKHYNIGFWFWELPSFPDWFSESFNQLNEIWVASTFCQEAISSKSPVPVVNIPLCIDLEVPQNIDRSSLGLPVDGFIFLSIMDVMSIPERKNPISVLEAFSKAFPPASKNTYLVLKLSNMDRCPSEIRDAIRSYLTHPNIILLEKYMNRAELNGLLNCADCYFSMHRSEGFGLPIAESMFLGKPVIATGWSSNMDFMNVNNSLPLQYDLVRLERDHGPYEKGNIWANPDIDHAVYNLKKIKSDDDLRSRIASQAAHDIKASYSPVAIGMKIRSRLKMIHGLHGFMKN